VADSCCTDPALAEALQILWRELREAKQRFQSGQDAGRDGAIHALETIVKFLGLFDTVRDEALHAPLARLSSDLMSLDDGTASAMLTPRRRRGRARASSFYDATKGVAVFTVQRVAATGITYPNARRMVATKLAEIGVRPARKGSDKGTGEFSERTLRKWQDDVAMNETARDTLTLLEAGHIQEVLEIIGLSALPSGTTADELMIRHFEPAELRRGYLAKLSAFITRIRGQETT
jgi:hypothetical protein